MANGVTVPGSLYLLLGNGDGTFQSPVPYTAAEFLSPISLVAGDFNGDGRLDLALIDDGNQDFGGTVPASVDVLLGNGDGTFQAPRRYVVGGDPLDLVAGDFTGDGKLDLAFASDFTNVIIGHAGQWRRHLPAREDIRGGTQPCEFGGG